MPVKLVLVLFAKKISMISFDYKLCGSRINRSNTVKDFEIILDTELYIHYQLDFVCSQTFKLLGLIRVTAFSFYL
jgi:hypothetical protein